MANAGRDELKKPKSPILKLWDSFTVRSRGNYIAATITPSSSYFFDNEWSISEDLQLVFVGESRRRYLIPSAVVDHPLFREVVEKGEVDLFEHLVWMLENADPQPQSMEELLDFYDC